MQQRLVAELFGIQKIVLVYGWSMGGQQAYHWGALFPDMVERICVVCGSARTSVNNLVFLAGRQAALTAILCGRTDGSRHHRCVVCCHQ
jgi:homoserine O-acetyltransferase